MSELLLTYIVPVYNTESYLDRCLTSLVNQGLAEEAYEVLVVDDGSTDGSRDRIAAFASQHHQVKLIIQENAGVSAARNRALDQARGRYVQFVDSDDYLLNDMMARLLQRAVDEDLDVLQFNYRSVDEAGIASPVASDDVTTPVMSGASFLQGHRLTPYVWRFLVKHEFLEMHHWRFNTSLIVCEDGALIAEFMLAAQRMACHADAPYCYVNRSDSAMHNRDLAHQQRRIFSQIDSAASIDAAAKHYEQMSGQTAPGSVAELRNVYLYFAMTRALTIGHVEATVNRMRRAGLFPFPCVGPGSDHTGMKWKLIHRLMMHPRLWSFLSRLYRMIKKS